MGKVENTAVYNIYPAIMSIRNAMKSWDRSDTTVVDRRSWNDVDTLSFNHGIIGPVDMKLALRLISRGGDERKFLRSIHVNADITVSRALWTEIDTYKVGTVRNSTSTMHSILNKNLTQEDFEGGIPDEMLDRLNATIEQVKFYKSSSPNDPEMESVRRRFAYLKHMLPEGYLMMANYDTNYESLLNMYHKRKTHYFLDWKPVTDWIISLPYMEEFYSAFVGDAEEATK